MPRLEIDSSGRVYCPSNPHLVTYGTPWPSPNGSNNFQEPANGYVVHTEVGYEHSVQQEFENPKAQASAFFSIAMLDGHIHQYGPVGKGWKAWTQVAGNPKYRGAENEDHGNPKNPLTAQQIESNASLVEVLSRKDGFPLQATDNANGGKGVLHHSSGGKAWGAHNCPGDVRRAQRPNIVKRAIAIRGNKPKPNPIPAPSTLVKALEQAVHVKVDGWWGKTFDAAINTVRKHMHNVAEQRAVGTNPDGAWGPASAKAETITIHRIQHALGVTSDGSWGPKTEAAFLAARKKYFTTSRLVGAVRHVRARLAGGGF